MHLPTPEVVLDIGGRRPAERTLGCIRGIFGSRHVKIGGLTTQNEYNSKKGSFQIGYTNQITDIKIRLQVLGESESRSRESDKCAMS